MVRRGGAWGLGQRVLVMGAVAALLAPGQAWASAYGSEATPTAMGAPSLSSPASPATLPDPTADLKPTIPQPAGTWSAGSPTGEFTWQMPMVVPPSAGTLVPDLALRYDSSLVDGLASSKADQASVVGEGWELATGGHIERTYRTCSQDSLGGVQSTTSRDLCWSHDNATLTLGGTTVPLVKDSAGTWRLKAHDGTRIVRQLRATNGDNDGEHWVVTTPDGVTYYFGLNRLPGWTTGKPLTNSVFTVPVFGDDTGEPCHASTFAASSCQQAWRWNLDYVVDPHLNAMSYHYTQETNSYRRNGTTPTAYIRGGYLSRIDYGLRATGSLFAQRAAQRVIFGVAERCLPTSTFSCAAGYFTTYNASRWPDTPVEMNCAPGKPCTGLTSPSFWTRKRLTSVTTQVATTTSYASVDRWALSHQFPPPGDTTSAALWLSSVQRTGLAFGSVTMPRITFHGTQMLNRVDSATDGRAPYVHYRVTAIRDEVGNVLGVEYSDRQCTVTTKPTSDSTNSLPCFPRWETVNGVRRKEYYHRYVVTAVYGQDTTPARASVEETTYEYVGGANWAYDRTDHVPTVDRTWSDWRGYRSVVTNRGRSDETPMKTSTTYFLGMHGDRTATGTRSVTVKDSDGKAAWDYPEYAGMPRETTTLNGSTVVTATSYTPTVGAVLASQSRPGTTPLTSRVVGTAVVATKAPGLTAGSLIRTSTSRIFGADGQLLREERAGDLALTGDEQCQTFTYAPSDGTAPLFPVAEARTVARSCSAQPLLPDDLTEQTRTSYDGAQPGATVTRGDVTRIERVSGWTNSAPEWTTVSTTSYDAFGRPTRQADALGHATTSAYTQRTVNGATSSVVTTNPLGHVTTQRFDVRGSRTALVDPNGHLTESTYDAVGRLTGVWAPGRARATQPATVQYAYVLGAGKVPAATTTHRWLDGTSKATVRFYDGLGRLRQEQRPDANGHRLVSNWFYDSRGLMVNRGIETPYTGEPSSTLVTQPNGNYSNLRSYAYDGAGRIMSDTLFSSGSPVSTTKHSYAGPTHTVAPPDGVRTTEVYDAHGRLSEMRRWSSSTAYESTTQTYDRHGRLASVTGPGGVKRTYAYDLLGRAVDVSDPNMGTTTTSYDLVGRPVQVTDGAGRSVTTAYDALGRVTSTRDGAVDGAVLTERTYDTVAKGMQSSATRYHEGRAYTQSVTGFNAAYEPLGQTYVVPASEGPLGGTYSVTTTYNARGNPEFVRLPQGGGLPAETVEYDYLGGRLAAITGYASRPMVTDVGYTAHGAVTRVALGTSSSGLDVVHQHDDRGRLLRTSIHALRGVPLVEDRQYTYDNAGNLSSNRVATPHPADADNQCFAYDALGRLTGAYTTPAAACSTPVAGGAAPTVGGPEAYWHSFDYDARGNRASLVDHSVTAPGEGTTTTYAYSADAASLPHAVTSTRGPETTAYGYDGAGRRTSMQQGETTRALTYSADGLLTSAGPDTSYVYDADGNLLLRKEAGRATLHLGEHMQLALDTATQTVTGRRFYQAPGGVTVIRTADGTPSGVISYSVDDVFGTPTLLLDHMGNVTARRRTAPFGADRGERVEWPGALGYRGGTELGGGLVLLDGRVYDATTGMFLTPDVALVSGSPYAGAGAR